MTLRIPLFAFFVLAAASLAVLPVRAHAGDDAAAAETEVVQPRRFVMTLELEGRLAPRDAQEVAYEAEVYGGPLEIVEAAGPRRVREGEVLVRFDVEEAKRALVQAERDREAARIRLAQQEATRRHDAEARARKLDGLEERARRAEADLSHWKEIERPLRVAQAEYSLEGSENRLQDEIEELEQLEKMYKADDLTEETEEIVIRRARRSLARMRRSIEFARTRHERLMEITLPREDHDREQDVAGKKGELEAYRTKARAENELADIALDKAREDFERHEERLADLRRDIDGLRLRASMDGMAVPGTFSNGSWGDVAAHRRGLEPGDRVKKGQVLFTIVTPGNVKVVTSVAEKDLHKLESGQSATVEAATLEDRELEAVVAEVLPLPTKGRCPVEIALKETDASLMPGVSAKVAVAYKVVPDAITVPAKALRNVEDEPHVWVVTDGEAAPRAVELGERAEGRVHVTSGLEAGETILAVAPKDDGEKTEKKAEEKGEQK